MDSDGLFSVLLKTNCRLYYEQNIADNDWITAVGRNDWPLRNHSSPYLMTVDLPVALNKLSSDRRAFGMTLRIEEQSLPGSLQTLLAEFGFAHPEAELFPISRERAWDVIAHLVAYDQAYDFPTGVIDIAEVCADEFLALFPPDCHFFTNSSEPHGVDSASWNPLTEATFDAGVVAISPGKVGVLWFEDED